MDKLDEILEYYKDTYDMKEDIDIVKADLLKNNVIVKGDSFYCPIWKENRWILLAGTKEKADLWVLKKIIKLIKSGDQIISVLNGNSEYLLKGLKRFDPVILNRDGELVYIGFNLVNKRS